MIVAKIQESTQMLKYASENVLRAGDGQLWGSRSGDYVMLAPPAH